MQAVAPLNLTSEPYVATAVSWTRASTCLSTGLGKTSTLPTSFVVTTRDPTLTVAVGRCWPEHALYGWDAHSATKYSSDEYTKCTELFGRICECNVWFGDVAEPCSDGCTELSLVQYGESDCDGEYHSASSADYTDAHGHDWPHD